MTALAIAPRLRDDAPISIDEAVSFVIGEGVALFLDVDGTLLDLAPTPDAVCVPVDLVGALARAESRLSGALALVSGRRIEDIDRLFKPLRLGASGVHGAQIRLRPDAAVEAVPAAVQLPASLELAVRRAIRRFPALLVENKGFSLAVHYRSVPLAADWLRETLQELILATPSWGLELLDAHFAFELKRPSFNKGKSIARFLQAAPFRGRPPMFVGDDATDEAGFAEVIARGGRAYSIGERRPGAIGYFESPRTVRAWLKALSMDACE
jgi:trehalose 6-phosphate phosphatase